jgi:hypothetical protein
MGGEGVKWNQKEALHFGSTVQATGPITCVIFMFQWLDYANGSLHVNEPAKHIYLSYEATISY